MQFDRRGWRSRNRLLENGEAKWITVPVQRKGHYHDLIRDIRLVDSEWPKHHLNMLRHLYRQAPHFQWCFDAIQAYLLKHRYEFLLDLCLEGHHILCSMLHLTTPIRLSSELGHVDADRIQRLISICSDLGGTRYISGPAARSYMDNRPWREAGIELIWHDFQHPTYRQFTDPFVSHLSVIDALMFLGPGTRDLLQTASSVDAGTTATRE